jgi:Rrf2 family transcriptional regulator, nitric oxide-sensitive transcriptional repressor
MQLTRFTDYTLRVLISVGLNDKRRESRGVTIGQISAQYGISRNHLMKVVQHLARAGYLETLRGKGGGLRLAVPASKINLGSVVRNVEGGFHIVPCFDEAREDRCAIVPACVLKNVLGKALGAFLAVLDGYTLEDLLGPDRELARLLAAGSTPKAPPPRTARPRRVAV